MAEFTSLHGITDTDVAAFRASGEFDEIWYLNEYRDVAKTGLDPALHYLWIGRRLTRKPSDDGIAHTTQMAHPIASTATPNGEQGPSPDTAAAEEGNDVRLIDKARRMFSRRTSDRGEPVYDLLAEHIDVDFYLTTYPDIALAGVDPARHYLETGWREHRDPSISFSTKFYLENNPDVAEAGVNPFYHYITAGKSEGRQGKGQLGFRWEMLSDLKSVADQIRQFKSHRQTPKFLDGNVLAEALTNVAADARNFILSFSHDDFTQNVGGVQLLLRRELKLVKSKGDVQVHIYPQYPLPFIDTSDDEIALGVLLNGKNLGNFRAKDIAACLGSMKLPKSRFDFVIHSLLGHNIDRTIDILSAAGATHGYIWIHDYAPLYNNYKLLRNDVDYSGFPRPGTLARELCEFARADFSHADEFSKLFNRFELTLLSPSNTALEIWNSTGLHRPVASHVVEHVSLKPTEPTITMSAASIGPLRVGFLGYPAAHKGWPVFQELALTFSDDPRFAFYHLGNGRRGGVPLKFQEVSANETTMDAMRQAVADAELDVALLWSIWPETFCLTAYEALAGGAVLVTNPNAGNIVRAIEETGQGAVISNEAALLTAFESGDILRFARSRRPVRTYAMSYSNLSFQIMD